MVFQTELRQTAEELSLERQQRLELEQRCLGIQQLEKLVQALTEQYQRHMDMQVSWKKNLHERNLSLNI